MKPVVFLFAGVPNSGKSIAAHYLSFRLNLPILSNDIMRYELRAITLKQELDADKYLELRDKRLNELIIQQRSFIYDASIDRRWREVTPRFDNAGFLQKIISFDLSEKFVMFLWREVYGKQSSDNEGRWLDEHQKFLIEFTGKVDLAINDSNYQNFLDHIDTTVVSPYLSTH